MFTSAPFVFDMRVKSPDEKWTNARVFFRTVLSERQSFVIDFEQVGETHAP